MRFVLCALQLAITRRPPPGRFGLTRHRSLSADSLGARRSPSARVGELSPEGVGYCDSGNQSEDGLKHFDRIAGAIKTSAGNAGDFCHQGASGAEQVKVPVKTSTIEHKER